MREKYSCQKKLFFFLTFLFLVAAPYFEKGVQGEAFLNVSQLLPDTSRIAILEKNSVLPFSPVSFQKKPRVIQRIKAIITAYSSTPQETDETPYITASGYKVRDGVVANNFFSFGTRLRIPEIFGDKVFVVEDRMNWKQSNYHIDVWFPSHQEAKNFGIRRSFIEILAD